ncbi:hypothetical protein DOY81_008514 [Sarcophaga bullata]|nr:hypothetical protein DOY81_008514 [Sarcophaga bullata]
MALNLSTLMLLLTGGNLYYPGISPDNCHLNYTHMSKQWVFLTRPFANTVDVLHTDYLNHKAILYMFCNSQTPIRELVCEDGELEETTDPNLQCNRRVRADIELSTVVDNSCRRLAGEIYNVVYNIPRGIKLPLYQVCYSTRNEEAIFTRHKAYGFNLPATNYRRAQFSLGAVVTRERADSFDPENVYDKFVELLGEGQTYIPDNTSLLLERGHLVNAQDFPSYDQMDETFKYINVAPQFRGSNRMNWRRIENWVHNLPSRDKYAEVVTGVYGILRLPHSTTGQLVDMYLMDNNKNPIPAWTYKVVKYNNVCYAFVTSNNIFSTNRNLRTDICQSVACPGGLQFTSAPTSTVAYCCNYNHLVRYVGSHARLC